MAPQKRKPKSGKGLFPRSWGLLRSAVDLGRTREIPEGVQPSTRLTWLLLGVILFAAGFLRFAPYPNELPGFYWYDCLSEMSDARDRAELGQDPVILPYGFRRPLLSYWMAAWFTAFPAVEGFLLQRWASGLLDLLAVLLCYPLGREIGGRRFGLLLAAFAAVSKPQIRESLYGIHSITAPFATVLCLLATLRLFRDPSPLRFLVWGLSITCAAYSYIGCLPLVFFLIFAVFAWILWDPTQRGRGSMAWSFPAAAGLTVAYFLLDKAGVIRSGTFLHELGAAPWVQALAGGVLVFLVFQRWRPRKSGGRADRVLLWAAVLFLAWLATLPLTRHPDFRRPVESLLVFGKGSWWDSLSLIGGNFLQTLRMFFLGQGDHGDSVLDPLTSGAAALGVVIALAKPQTRTLFLLLVLGASLLPSVLAANLHHGRAMTAVVPFAIFAAIAVDRLGNRLTRSPAVGRLGPWAFLALGVLVPAWSGADNYRRLYYEWASGENASILCAKAIREDAAQKRVFYLGQQGSFASTEVVAALSGKNPCYFAGSAFTLHLWPEEPVPEIEVLLEGQDPGLRGRIEKDYPQARWAPLRRSQGWWGKPLLRHRGPAQWITFPPPGGEGPEPPLAWKVVVPASAVGGAGGGMFQVKRLKAGEWKMQLYGAGGRLGRGPILWETGVPSMSAPYPSIQGNVLRLEGRLFLESAGDYRFALRGVHFVDAFVDGRKTMSARSGPKDISSTLRLEAGTHTLEFVVFRGSQGPLPPLEVEGPLARR